MRVLENYIMASRLYVAENTSVITFVFVTFRRIFDSLRLVTSMLLILFLSR